MTGPAPVTRKQLLAGLLSVLAGTLSAAEPMESLYQSRCVVTGRDNLSERERGFRQTLEQVIVKVTGDIRLRGDPRISSLWPELAAVVTGFRYEDRKKGIQISDEQGTRDRSFDLTVDFDRVQIDTAIAALGGKPWPVPRPVLLVLLHIEDNLGGYLLGLESERGFGQREALSATAQHLGVPLVLPRMDVPERSEIAAEEVGEGSNSTQTIQKKYPADFLLTGRMALTEKGYWDTEWRLGEEGAARAWRIEGVIFDHAIDDGLGRSARILSGLE